MLAIPIMLLLTPTFARPRIVLQAYSALVGFFFAAMWGAHFWQTSRPDFHDGAGGAGFGILIFIYWTAAFVAGFALRLIVDALAIVVKGAVGPEARKRRRRLAAKMRLPDADCGS